MSAVVLLTGTIDSSVYNNTGNKIVCVEERFVQYSRSIERYICDSVFDVIVFAENSGYEFDHVYYENLAEHHGKRFEFISCPRYVQDTIARGKSYGEARLIDDALRLSNLLKDEEIIYKITGRIFLKNSKAIFHDGKHVDNAFLVYQSRRWCFTNIFRFCKSDYLKYWKDVFEKCNEKDRKDIETVFYDIIEEAVKKGMSVNSFPVWPNFDGIQGATLEPYSGGLLERVGRTVLCKLGCFKYGTFFARVLKV